MSNGTKNPEIVITDEAIERRLKAVKIQKSIQKMFRDSIRKSQQEEPKPTMTQPSTGQSIYNLTNNFEDSDKIKDSMTCLPLFSGLKSRTNIESSNLKTQNKFMSQPNSLDLNGQSMGSEQGKSSDQ